MASRLSGGSYAAPGTYAAAQSNINLNVLSPQASGSGVTGLGVSNTIQPQVVPVSIISGSGATITVTCGEQIPGWVTAGTTVVLGGGASGAFAGSYTVASVVAPGYIFTITNATTGTVGSLSSSNMTAVFSGTSTGTAPALQAYAPVLNGTTIKGSSTGPCEIWDDGAIWDTTNSRYLSPGIDFPPNGAP
jgi:hypothetical protein